MARKVRTIINLDSAIRADCPILLKAPKDQIPSLSETFGEETTSHEIKTRTEKGWIKARKNEQRLHAVIETKDWDDFSTKLRKLETTNKAKTNLYILYQGHTMSYYNATQMGINEAHTNNILSHPSNILADNKGSSIGIPALSTKDGTVAFKIPVIKNDGSSLEWVSASPNDSEQLELF